MATTQSYSHEPLAGSSAIVIDVGHDRGQRYASSRLRSSSGSGTHPRPVVGKSQMPVPAYDRASSGYFSRESEIEEVLDQQGSTSVGQNMRMDVQGAFAPLSTVAKGKQRAATTAEDPSTMLRGGQERRRAFKSDWVIDDADLWAGADAWVERDRVILVLGHPTPDSLSPLLYNPQYAQTLLIIALSQPSSAFDQLASQTPSDRTTYPIIQLLDVSKVSKANPTHPLPPVLEQASKMSSQWRASLRSPSSSRMSLLGSASRRTSTDSMASSLPPLTPPMTSRSHMSAPQIYSRRSSETSDGSQSEWAHKRSSVAPASRPPVSNRKSSFFGLGKSASDAKTPSPASPFDAVIHFIPPAAHFAPNRALQEMLQSAVLLTSTVVPTLAKRNMSSNKTNTPDPAPITLLHVLPPNSPQALPHVMENFVLSLISKFRGMAERRLSGYVVNQPAWLHPAEGEIMSGGDILLFGGAHSRPSVAPDGTPRVKERAYVPYWPHQGPPMAVAPNPDFTRADYSTMVPLAPPAPIEKPMPPRRKSTAPRSPPGSRPATTHHRSGLSQVIMPSDLEDEQSLNTPELDHAPSSASSQSHEAATPRASTYGSELSSPTTTLEELKVPTMAEKDRKHSGGFSAFVKRFGKKH